MTYVKAAAAQNRPLTIDERNQWNSLIDYMKKRGVSGSVDLDNRDTGLGQKIMEEYRVQNPHFTLTYPQVAQVQKDLQDYRANLLQKYKAGTATSDVPPEQVMAGLSPVDGWLGSKTSSWKYPGAAITNSDGSVTNFGLNTAAYDAAMAKLKK